MAELDLETKYSLSHRDAPLRPSAHAKTLMVNEY